MSNSHPSSTLVDRYPDSGVSSSEDYNYLSYPNNPRPIDLSSTFATDAVGVNDSISQVGTFDTHMSEGNQPNLADTRNGFAAAAEEMEVTIIAISHYSTQDINYITFRYSRIRLTSLGIGIKWMLEWTMQKISLKTMDE